jgi:cell division septation protein DedD
MASRGNRGGGGDRVLESRHVIGLFLLMLVFSGVFFALGYVMGRNQYDGQVRAESTPRATPDPVYAAKSEPAARRPKNSQSGSQSATNSASSSSSTNSGWGSASSTPSSASPRGGGSTPAATPGANSNGNPDESAAPTSDWSYFSSAKNVPDDRLTPAANTSTPSSSTMSSAPSSTTAAAGKNPKPASVSNSAPSKAVVGTIGSPVPAGSYVLQVAAMRETADANAVVKSLVAKHFPAFVVNPTTDKYYHVQVGPYHDVKSADAAKKGLESAGFKAIVKH